MVEVVVEVEGVALVEEADAGVPGEASTEPISIIIIITEAEVAVETVTQNVRYAS